MQLMIISSYLLINYSDYKMCEYSKNNLFSVTKLLNSHWLNLDTQSSNVSLLIHIIALNRTTIIIDSSYSCVCDEPEHSAHTVH